MIEINKYVFSQGTSFLKTTRDRLEHLAYCAQLTQKVFAERCGMTEYRFRQLKNNQYYRNLHPAMMNRITKETGVRVEWINSGKLPAFEEVAK